MKKLLLEKLGIEDIREVVLKNGKSNIGKYDHSKADASPLEPSPAQAMKTP